MERVAMSEKHELVEGQRRVRPHTWPKAPPGAREVVTIGKLYGGGAVQVLLAGQGAVYATRFGTDIARAEDAVAWPLFVPAEGALSCPRCGGDVMPGERPVSCP